MPAYHYRALRDKKELSGIIEAPDEQAASAKLNQLGLSVVSMNVSQAPSNSVPGASEDKRPVFEFEAIDANGKKVVGTIRADDELKAFTRLFDEYNLNVMSLFSAAASPADKQKKRADGIASVRQQYELLYGKDSKRGLKIQEEVPAAPGEERKKLFDIVDYTVKRIEEFLSTYNAEIKPEEKETLRAYINQLMRIRESTNLDHIRSTCERMLEHMQKQELFVNEAISQKESSQIKVETKELLGQLKRSNRAGDIDFVKAVEKLVESQSAGSGFFAPLARFVHQYLPHDSIEVVKKRQELSTVNHQLIIYLKMALLSGTATVRKESWSSAKMLMAQRARIKMDIASLKSREKTALSGSVMSDQVPNTQTAYVIGWVLAFYLCTYMISYPLTTKDFGMRALPKSIFFYHGGISASITLFLFLSYGALSIKNYWLKSKTAVSLVLYPLSIFFFLLIAINLL